jgi:hypothetical protein
VYDGTQKVEGNSKWLWNGHGRVGSKSRGFVEVETKDEQVDTSKCFSEALSGTTTLRGASSATAVVSYDGAAKCDSGGAATWTLNGAAQGEVQGIGCQTATGPYAWLAVAAMAIAQRLYARRRRAATARS